MSHWASGRRLISGGSVLSCLAMLCLSSGDAQTFTVTPDRFLVDRAPAIRASGLVPGRSVTITADLVDGAGAQWHSEAQFKADGDGTVDVAAQAPEKGSYLTASAGGLIWSMKPVDKDTRSYRPPQRLAAQKVTFTLLEDGRPVASASGEQLASADGVEQVKITGQLHGTLFVPPGTGSHPGMLVLGGSEGGMPVRRAAWLASHGYAALALAYFRYENLPELLESIPLEYFGEAIGWMRQRAAIQSDRIGIMGTSRGGEAALQVAALYPDIRAVIAYVPSNVRRPACCGRTLLPYAWTLRGAPLAFVRSSESPAPGAVIPVENVGGPMLLIGGEDDKVWDSSTMVRAAAARLKHAHFAYEVQTLVYPHAGHTAGRPEIVPEWHGTTIHPVSGRPMELGGTVEGNAASSEDAGPKVLEFLRKVLGP